MKGGSRPFVIAPGERLRGGGGGSAETTRHGQEIQREDGVFSLLSVLALEGCIVTIDAMGAQPSIAQAIRDRGAGYVLAVKDSQAQLCESLRDFFALFQDAPGKTPHAFYQTLEPLAKVSAIP